MSGNEGSDRDEIDEESISESVEGEYRDFDYPLPEKSKIAYNNAYNKFIEWKRSGGDKPMSEKLMLDYFIYLYEVQKRKPSTLWSIYSMVKMTIKANDKVNIGRYKKLNAYLKEQSIGFESKKSKCLTSADIEKFLNEAPDRKYLAVKVSLIFAIIGSCRREELCNITVKDIEDDGTFALIKIRNPETEVERSFTIVDEFYSIYKKYSELRPRWAKTDRFFMQYIDGKCTQQVIGLNKFGSMPKLIASWLKLPDAESYTGHSFRRSSAILLADSGADLSSIRANSELKTKVAKCHAKNSLNRKKKLSEQIMKKVILKSATTEQSTSIAVRPSTSLSPAAFLIPTPSTPSSSVTSSTPSTPNFETIYFPLKEECADDNSEAVREENPLREKNKSELLGEMRNTNIQSDIQVQDSSATPKIGVKPVLPVAKTILPSASLISSSLPVLAPLSQPPGPPRTLHLRKILPKAPPDTPAPAKEPIVLKSQKKTPAKPLIGKKPLNAPPKQPIIQQPRNTSKSAGVCLRWKSYHSNMQNSFPSLLDSEAFVDVTLACEGKSVKCHKIILSSCSDYLSELLKENPCPHPIILMKDSKFWEIEALVQFMYKGETHVPHEQLPELLKAAKALGIKGLAGFTLAKVPNQPVVVSKQATQKSSLPEAQKKTSTAKPSLIQLNTKRASKRPLETTDTRPLVKIRLQRTKSPVLRPESPEIKYEPIDLPQSPNDNIPDNNYDNSVQDYIDLEEMHHDNDPGGTDDHEKMEFVGNEFLDDQDILDVIDHEACRSSLIDNEKISEISANNILRMIDGSSLEECNEDDDLSAKSKEKDET